MHLIEGFECISEISIVHPLQVTIDNLSQGLMVVTVRASTLVYTQRYSLAILVNLHPPFSLTTASHTNDRL